MLARMNQILNRAGNKKYPFTRKSMEDQDLDNYLPLVVVGPSGVGKGTLIEKLLDQYKGQFVFSVSYTTRPPRDGEIDGVHYYFIDKPTFEKMISDNDFIEYVYVHSNLYGTAKSQVQSIRANNKVPILDIHIEAVKKVKDTGFKANCIFICPPSVKALENRMKKRGKESEEQIATRLRNALDEINQSINESGMIHNRIVNHDIKVATKQFIGVVEGLYVNEL